tara:strand:- start:1923 stop:2561 length:639 start_codon:yes stop_codon:yes gene_type:complete
LNIENKKILCVILAGGLSKRFGGSTKTFTKINGITIFERILNLLKKQNIKIIINANTKSKKFLESKLPIIKDKNQNFQGPLAGILTSMIWAKEKNEGIEWIFSVPSDTPFLPKNLLEKFTSQINNSKKIYIARSNTQIHPVIGLWNVSLIENLEKELMASNRKIMNWVYKNKFQFVDFYSKKYDPFFNINRKEDLIDAINIDKIISQSCEKL